ncbi:MAG TPA: DUF222 domain-containing protein [Mycobacteriales bacterium]|nr:DUF222 domain-containing protein [Mycobacteriales bacterium]
MSQVLSVLDALAAADVRSESDAALLAEIEELLQARSRLDGLISQRLQVAESRQATINEAGRATRSWLIEEQRLSPTEAGQRVAVARSRPFQPKLAAALDAGDISHEHARLINGCLSKLPLMWREDAESILVDAARSMDPVTLGQVAREIRLRSGADEDREAREQRMYADRWAKAVTTFEGMLHLEAMLDPESGETMLAALNALTQRAVNDAGDERTSCQRKADALVDLARHSLACDWLPDVGGQRPTVVTTLSWEALRAELDATDAGGNVGRFDVSPATARRLACDANLIPAVLGSDGAVLDLGRATPVWTPAQRRAAAIRDGGCTFPGCQAGLDRCQLHHLKHWAHGGPTDLPNSAYLCHFHHWLVHNGRWTIWRNAQGGIEVRRT